MTLRFSIPRRVARVVYNETHALHAKIGLFDRTSGNIAWWGEMHVTGLGQASTTDKAFIRAATNEIASQRPGRFLRVNGVLGERPQIHCAHAPDPPGVAPCRRA